MPGTSGDKQLRALGDPKWAKGFCAVAIAAILVATLWPLNPFPRNRVTWLQGTSGLRFEEAGLVVSTGPLSPPPAYDTESYTVELLLRPASIKSLYTILAFYSPTRPRQLLVRQWTDGLLVTHDASVESDSTRTIKLDVDHVFHPGKLVFLTVSSGANGTTVYADGQPAQSFPRFMISRSELDAEIVLGTSPVTYNPWPGEIHGLAIYARELTESEALEHYKDWTTLGRPQDVDTVVAGYLFGEAAGHGVHNEVAGEPDLDIPATFSVPRKGFLQSPLQEFRPGWSYAFDLVLNIAGFIPLGVVVCSYLLWSRERWKAVTTTIVVCATFSFVIEMLQYYIPKRDSGVTDIITNALGAALGAVLTQTVPFRRALDAFFRSTHQFVPKLALCKRKDA
jgi:VanZ family protein